MQLKSIAAGLLLAGSSLLSAVSASPTASSKGDVVRNGHANKHAGKIAPKVFIISMVGGSLICDAFWTCLQYSIALLQLQALFEFLWHSYLRRHGQCFSQSTHPVLFDAFLLPSQCLT